MEKIVGMDDSKFSGIDLATLIRNKYGRSYDVQLIKKVCFQTSETRCKADLSLLDLWFLTFLCPQIIHREISGVYGLVQNGDQITIANIIFILFHLVTCLA